MFSKYKTAKLSLNNMIRPVFFFVFTSTATEFFFFTSTATEKLRIVICAMSFLNEINQKLRLSKPLRKSHNIKSCLIDPILSSSLSLKGRKGSSSFHSKTNEVINYSDMSCWNVEQTVKGNKNEQKTVINNINKVHHI